MNLCNPKDPSPPGSSVHGILQAKVLKLLAIPFSRGSSWLRDRTWNLLHCRLILYHWSHSVQFSSVHSLSNVQLFATPWTAAPQTSLSTTNSWNLLKIMYIESMMPSNHLILCHPLLLPPSIFPSIRVFSSESVLSTGRQSIGVSASASVLLMNTQDWSPLGWTGWISL